MRSDLMVGLRNATLRSITAAALQTTLLIAATLLFFAGTALAAPPDTMRIWRAQVRFITSGAAHANTDDRARVELNEANGTWLDSGRDDRERNSDETFDLRLDGVATLSDIDYFRIQKMDTNAWAIHRMYLIINEEVIYEEEFPSDLWLDNGDGHASVYFLDDSFMRPRNEWLGYQVPARPNVVPLNAMERRMESLFGDFLTANFHNEFDLIGGDNSVEAYAINAHTWRVDVDLERSLGPPPDFDRDVDFDLSIACSSWQPDFTVQNIHDHTPGVVKDFLNGDFLLRLNQMMKNFSFLPLCPTIVLASNGDLYFNPTVPPMQEAPIEVADDSTAPIDLSVVTGYTIKSSVEAKFIATVKSKLEKDAEVDVSFELPVQIVAWDDIVEVKDAGKSRTISAKVTANADGTSSIAFRELIPAGKNTEYTLHLMFQPKEDGTQLLVTKIQPATRELQASTTPLTATTYFDFKSGAVIAKGTTIQSSTYITSGKESAVGSK
jgi:hypothetical protein